MNGFYQTLKRVDFPSCYKAEAMTRQIVRTAPCAAIERQFYNYRIEQETYLPSKD